jgi:hypothetical protein
MTIPLWVLLGFAGWTLVVLSGTIGVYRWFSILTELILVRHGVSFHESAPTTARSSGSFLTKKNATHNGATISA